MIPLPRDKLSMAWLATVSNVGTVALVLLDESGAVLGHIHLDRARVEQLQASLDFALSAQEFPHEVAGHA